MPNLVFSQVPMEYEIMNYMASQRPDPDKNDKAAVEKRFKSYFIKKMFLNNIFNSSHLFYGEDSNMADYGLVNEMMTNQFADHLAESDFMDLSGILLDDQ